MSTSHAAMAEEIARLRSELAEVQAEVKRLRDERDSAIRHAMREIERLRAELAEARTQIGILRSDSERVHQELDRLGAPRQQDSGFGYSLVGRLRKLAANECGDGLRLQLMGERNEARDERAQARAEVKRLREFIMDLATMECSDPMVDPAFPERTPDPCGQCATCKAQAWFGAEPKGGGA